MAGASGSRKAIDTETIRAFQKFDADGSGGLDASELRVALKEAGLEVTGDQCEYMLRKYDDDRGATLDIEEFAQLLQDLRVNTDASVQERLNLRTHPEVAAALAAWWSAASSSLESAQSADVSTVHLTHDVYIVIMKKSARAPELGSVASSFT